jgi:aminomethyltransferase
MKETPLTQSHIALNAKMAVFADYNMPLYYDLGVKAEHLWTRDKAGVFDVSHMGQVFIEGEHALNFIESITPSSFGKTPINMAKYTVLTNENGGIIDDLIITKLSETRFFAVINAGCKYGDLEWMHAQCPDGVEISPLLDRGLIALQGPAAERVLTETLSLDLLALKYMRMVQVDDLFISRLGYTGEDGFEISLPSEYTGALWDSLMDHGSVQPVGLAARDSLRLEMGYPLYGHDIDAKTTPIEADLAWVMGKKVNRNFIGADAVFDHVENDVDRVRVGYKITGKGVAREGAEIRNKSDEKIGIVTSGGFSPSLECSIGMGYIDPVYKHSGTEIFIHVRDRNIDAVISDMPFVVPQTKTSKKG